VQRPIPRANVGWGFFRKPSEITRQTHFRPPSFGRSRSIWALSLHPRPVCKHLARKCGPETPQIAGFTACSTKGISREGVYGEQSPAGALASLEGRQAIPPALLWTLRTGRFFRRRPGPRSRSLRTFGWGSALAEPSYLVGVVGPAASTAPRIVQSTSSRLRRHP
jgi:hypothetical protein